VWKLAGVLDCRLIYGRDGSSRLNWSNRLWSCFNGSGSSGLNGSLGLRSSRLGSCGLNGS
jgi:hypothetical protein